MHALGGKHVRTDQIVQRPQQRSAAAHLIGERRQAQLDALAGVALRLAVERLMLAVLLEQDHRQQRRPGKAARQHVERRGHLRDLLAVPAGELLAHVLHHLPLPRHHVQCLGDILAELGEPLRAAAGAGIGTGQHDPLARQMRGERLARGPVARKAMNGHRLADSGGCLLSRKPVLRRGRFELLQLKLHLVEQVRLALAALSKELAPHLRNRQA